jgi:hypothetical protein
MHTGRGLGGEKGDETAPPRQIFEKLVNKNAIKPKIGDPPGNFVLRAWTPHPGILEKFELPYLEFQPLCIYVNIITKKWVT